MTPSSPGADFYPFRDRPPTSVELERFRLVLSCFRDGSGMVKRPGGRTEPGWRDFERTIAEVVGGTAAEDKGPFDVQVPVAAGLPFGLSCKLAAFQPSKNNSALMEMANAAAGSRNALHGQGINWATEPHMAGPALIQLILDSHQGVSAVIDVARSCYLALGHDSKYDQWRLAWFDLDLKRLDPTDDIAWTWEGVSLRGRAKETERLIWQYYPTSGGQLKYFPSLSWAEWVSDEFRLEEPPIHETLSDRAERYFTSQWQ